MSAPIISPFSGTDIAALLEERARMRGDHPILVWAPFEGSGCTWSYQQFRYEVAQVAGGLAVRGVKPGDRVLVHLENCPEALIARFACAWLGAVCVGSNAMAAAPEIAHYVKTSGAQFAITQPKLAARVGELVPDLRWIVVTDHDAGAPPASGTAPAPADSFRSLLKEPLPRRTPDASAPASLMFTTGTTSSPKPVLWTHANMLWGARLGAYQQQLRPDDRALVFLPLHHVVGLTWSFAPMLWAGGTVVLQPRFSVSRFWPVSLRERATIASQVGFTAAALQREEVPIAHHYRQWIVSHHDPERNARFRIAHCLSAWGMTELIAPGIVGDPWGEQRQGTVGRPSLGYDVRIVDDDGRPVAPGDRGHLLIGAVRGLSIFSEYYGNPVATAEAFDEDGYFRTGDIVTLHEGGWVQYRDRAKDVIKVGGEGVSASEVEEVVRSCAGVAEAAVVGKPDPVYGEVAVAFVVLEAEANERLTLERITQRCQASLAKFKVPRDVIVLPEMPLVGNGKIAKAKLRQRFENRLPAAGRDPLVD